MREYYVVTFRNEGEYKVSEKKLFKGRRSIRVMLKSNEFLCGIDSAVYVRVYKIESCFFFFLDKRRNVCRA